MFIFSFYVSALYNSPDIECSGTAGNKVPDLESMKPKVTVMINESDVIDIGVVKHGKDFNFFINLSQRNQILLSAESAELKQRVCSRVSVCFTFRWQFFFLWIMYLYSLFPPVDVHVREHG